MRFLRASVLGLSVAACGFDDAGAGAGAATGSGSTGTHRPDDGSTAAVSTGRTTSGGMSADATSMNTSTTTQAEASTNAELDDTSDATGTAKEPCDRALFVTADVDVPNTIDAPLYYRLLELDFEVTVVWKPDSTPEDVGDNCVVIISDLGSSADVNIKFLDAPVGVVILEPGLYDDMRFVASTDDMWWGDDDGLITIVDPSHPLAVGLEGVIAIYEAPARGSWGRPVESAQVVAIWGGDPDLATLMAFETGAVMAHDFVAPARRVGFPGGVTPVPMTAHRIDLFEAAVLWAAEDIP